MTRVDLAYFDQFTQDLEDLAFEYKAHIARDPKEQAKQQYAEGSMGKWLTKNTKQMKEWA